MSQKTKTYLVIIDGIEKGPYSSSLVIDLVEKGVLLSDTPILQTGGTEWKCIKDISALRKILNKIDNTPHYIPFDTPLDTPLSSGEQAKIVFFFLLCIPPTIFIVGILPMIFIAIGWFLMRLNAQFSSLKIFINCAKVFMLLIAAAAVWMFFYHVDMAGDTSLGYYKRDDHRQEIGVAALVFFITAMYYAILHFLFFIPLEKHKNWIAKHGVFSSFAKANTDSKLDITMDIIKGEKLHTYSVAEELTKWANLRKSGHISEAEYIKASSKLLHRKV